MLPSPSDAVGNFPAQYLGSAEKSLRRWMLSSDTPMIVAPAAVNLSLLTAKVCA